jgi:hypothetical protein
MTTVKTQTWQTITKFYRDRTEKNPFFRPMLELAEQIAASKYASGLYPWNSMQTLCISQTPEADLDKEVLRISLDPQDGALVFDFQETSSKLAEIPALGPTVFAGRGLVPLRTIRTAQEMVCGLRAAVSMSAIGLGFGSQSRHWIVGVMWPLDQQPVTVD